MEVLRTYVGELKCGRPTVRVLRALHWPDPMVIGSWCPADSTEALFVGTTILGNHASCLMDTLVLSPPLPQYTMDHLSSHPRVATEFACGTLMGAVRA